MKNLSLHTVLAATALSLAILLTTSCKKSGNKQGEGSGKYQYETVANDPINAKLYTLKNGMKLYLSVNKNEPRVQTMLAVRAGSKQDPTDCTGLAHYLEHMVFKGTSKIGALNWEAEKVLLQQISDLYEAHRQETDAAKRKAIYSRIDSLSNEAAKFVGTNEYDKLVASLGAKGTNAFTSLEETVYINDIPSNELEKWMRLESERMSELVLRLFHTELEAVYEEFNRGQDNDGRKSFYALMESLFPTHTYGTQSTIGKGEHLKNPSMVKIHEFFNTYYVPNNMAMIVAGDFNPDEVVALAEKYFGAWETKPVPEWKVTPQAPITAPIAREVVGPDRANVMMAWRLDGINSPETVVADMVGSILNNGNAGIMDIQLLQKQKVQSAYAYNNTMTDYGMFVMGGTPRQGQTLEQVRDLLLAQLDSLKEGKFQDWLPSAAIKDLKYGELKAFEGNYSRANAMLENFIYGRPWAEYVSRYDRMKAVTREQMIDFVNKHLRKDNYVVVFKREGVDKNVLKVEKPKITPIQVNRKEFSSFKQAYDSVKSPELKPVFVDFKSTIKSSNLDKGVRLDYIKNEENATFKLSYVLDMGKKHDKVLPIALRYLTYLGTDKYSPTQLKEEFFKLGVQFDVFSSDDRVYVSLEGLDESFDQGVELFEHVLANVKPEEEVLKNLVSDLVKGREDAKKNKGNILNGAMFNYGRFGAKSPFTLVLSNEELAKLTPQELVDRIKALTTYEHRAFYYGSLSPDVVKATLNKHHKVADKLKPYPAMAQFPELATDKNKVYFINYPMVQAEIVTMSKGTPKFDLSEYIMGSIYNNYFGSGLSSIVFQEIRESKALAYAASAGVSSPEFANEAHYLRTYVGTQADKLKEAVPAMKEILENMPISEGQIATAAESILKRIESERITRDGIYWTYLSNQRRGYDKDLRQETYNFFKGKSPAEIVEALKSYHAEKIKGRTVTYLVIGDKKMVDMTYLASLGEFKELTLTEVFGY